MKENILSLVCLGALVQAIAATSVNAPSTPPSSQLQKRAQIVVCPSGPIPPGYPDSRTYTFPDMYSMCVGYPNGVGMICSNEGHLIKRSPAGTLATSTATRGADSPIELCLLYCSCKFSYETQYASSENSGIASTPVKQAGGSPGTENEEVNSPPANSAAAIAAASAYSVAQAKASTTSTAGIDSLATISTLQSSDPSGSQSRSRSGSVTSDGTDGYVMHCSNWYGRPLAADCVQAIRAWRAADPRPQNPGTDLEFLRDGAITRFPRLNLPAVRLPQNVTHGTCSLTMLPPEDHVQTFVSSWKLPEVYFDEIHEWCASERSLGGDFNGGRADLPSFVLYGPNSRFEKNFNANLRTLNLSPGKVITSYDDNEVSSPAAKKPKQSDRDSSPAGRTRNGVCYTKADCGDDENTICAYPNQIDLPLSASWGRFRCMSIDSVALTIASAVALNGCRRGRCLIEPDGSLQIFNATDIEVITRTNVTVALPASPSLQPSPVPSLPALQPEVDILSTTLAAAPALQSSAADAHTHHHYSHYTHPGAKYEISHQTLICPCNCTYVSAACCFSSIVYESPADSIGGASFHPSEHPSNTIRRCDLSTGLWDLEPRLIDDVPSQNSSASATTIITNAPTTLVSTTRPSATKPASTQSATEALASLSASTKGNGEQCAGFCTSVVDSCAYKKPGTCICASAPTGPQESYWTAIGSCYPVVDPPDGGVDRASSSASPPAAAATAATGSTEQQRHHRRQGVYAGAGIDPPDTTPDPGPYIPKNAVYKYPADGYYYDYMGSARIACPCNSTCVSYGCCGSTDGIVRAPRDSCQLGI